MAVGDNIKQIRIERRLTQKELSEQMGISRSYLSDVENNRHNPSMKTVTSLAENLNVDIIQLIK
jgi:transcriptional regulator with XRE-family HTH domain